MTFLSNSFFSIIISLTLIYALLSILVSSLTEWWNTWSKTRGKDLKKAIVQMLDDPFNHNYGALFFDHIMIRGLSRDVKTPTAYISSSLFADALIDILANQAVHAQQVTLLSKGEIDPLKGKEYEAGVAPPSDLKERLEASWKLMKNSPFKDLMESFWLKGNRDVDQFKKQLESWFNDHMDRVSGWYKNKTRTQSMIFGFAVAIGLNVDSLHLVKVLSLDPNTRNNLVSIAENVADEYVKDQERYSKSADQQFQLVSKAIPDSIKAEMTSKPKSALTYFLKKKDSVHYNQMISFIKSDSLAKHHADLADSVLGITASLNIPIGYSYNTAPVSWAYSSGKCVGAHSHSLRTYTAHRNMCRSFSNIFVYLLGIIISGFSLSLGAPFWFELLVKFVNIRRTGKRPETKTATS